MVNDTKKYSTLLPPLSAVRMVWARTGAFSDDEHSKIAANLTEARLNEIKDKAEEDEKEERYILSTFAIIDASYRNLDIIHKKRTQNFKENDRLRAAYMESIKETLNFGTKANDFLRSLPAMTIGGAGGLTITNAFAGDNDLIKWAVGLGVAGIGYLVNMGIVRLMRKRKQMLYIGQEYDRAIYFDQYVSKVNLVLTSLYMDLNRIHKNIFGNEYPINGDSVKDAISDILKGAKSTFCKHVHKHMDEKKITPELWPLCETGTANSIDKCKHWE